MDEQEQVKNELDVKFYPVKNRHMENLIHRVYRLILIVLALALLSALMIWAIFSGYALQDFRLVEREIESLPSLEHQVLSAIPHSIEMPSFFAGHSLHIAPGSVFHTRQTHHAEFSTANDTQDAAEATSAVQYGIDVSHWQQNINWQSVAADTVPHPLSFAIVKATQGTGHIDPDFNDNWKAVTDIFEHTGAYHFFVFKDDPDEQAQHYINTVTLAPGSFPPIADVEYNCAGCNTLDVSREELIEGLTLFLNRLEDHFGVSPLIYTNEAFYEQYLEEHLQGYRFWIARYNQDPPPGLVSGEQATSGDANSNNEVVMWQFTNSERIGGIVGNVNMNYLPPAGQNRIQFVD